MHSKRPLVLPSLRPSRQPRYPWTRMDAWVDAIYAIAATLLIIEIQPPEVEHGRLAQALLDQWPQYLTYALGFVYIAGGWSVTRRLSAACWAMDHYAMLLAFLAQFSYILTPFTMAVLGDSTSDHDDLLAAVRLFLIVTTFGAGTYTVLFLYLERVGLFRTDVDPDTYHLVRVVSLPAAAWPLAALLLTFVIGPWALAIVVANLISIFMPLDLRTTETYFGGRLPEGAPVEDG
jgi:uncharacterized membrane protein